MTEFLTRPGDLVFDPFGGSNTTGAVAERLGRRWSACEIEPSGDYIRGSSVRFERVQWAPGFKPLRATQNSEATPARAAHGPLFTP